MSAIPMQDLDHPAAKGDIAELRAEMHADLAGLRAGFETDSGSYGPP